MKKTISSILVLIAIVICTEEVLAENVRVEEFLKKLISILGLEDMLPDNPSADDCIIILESKGIIPKGAYKSDVVLAKNEIAYFINQVIAPFPEKGTHSVNKIRVIHSTHRITPSKILGDVRVKTQSEGTWRELTERMCLNENDILKIGRNASVNIRFGDICNVGIDDGVSGTIKDLVNPKDVDLKLYMKRYVIPYMRIPDCRNNCDISAIPLVGAVRD